MTKLTITINLDDAILIARGCLPRNERKMRGRDPRLVAAITRFKAAVVAGNLATHSERKPDIIDAIKTGERDIIERKAGDAAFAVSQAKDRKLAYEVALYALRGVRLHNKDAPDGHPFAYFAEETRSWWAITPDAMIQLADMLEAKPSEGRENHPEVIEAWAEADKTAIELDRALSRRLSREHGR